MVGIKFYLQGWGLLHIPFHEGVVPNVQPKPPLVYSRLFPLISVPWEQILTPLAVLSWQGVVQSHKVPPEAPFLQAEPLSQLPQPLLIIPVVLQSSVPRSG